ncbi:MAG: Lrp/AsnC family transcriptional regulator [Pseudomonadales bacterium]
MNNQSLTLDRTDKRILEQIQNNDRMSNLELADSIGLSATPCARRVKRLEDAGVIRGHATLLDESILGLKLTALISISMDRHTPERFENFEAQIMRFPEIVECSLVTGQSGHSPDRVASTLAAGGRRVPSHVRQPRRRHHQLRFGDGRRSARFPRPRSKR